MTTSRTALYALPYPEGDEYVISGDDALEALAKALEERLRVSYCHSNKDTPGAQATAAGGTLLEFGGWASTEGEWEYVPGQGLKYLGRPRWFAIHVDVDVVCQTAGGNAGGQAILYTNDTVCDGGNQYIAQDEPTSTTSRLTHNLAHHGPLLPGDFIRARVFADGEARSARMHVTSISPREGIGPGEAS